MLKKIDAVKNIWHWQETEYAKTARFILKNKLYEIKYTAWPKKVALELIFSTTRNIQFMEVINSNIKSDWFYRMEFDIVGGNYKMLNLGMMVPILGIVLNTMRDLADKDKVSCYFYHNQAQSKNKSLYSRLTQKIGRGHGWKGLSCNNSMGCHVVWRDTTNFKCFKDIS